ncbi:MAG: hypothetical protein CL670_05565 [Balneola sp.]|nr:hypothetical protein [Balneola sp.]MBE78602.1 hypothetical protein [Balneola sp.]|tara:strand:- start:275 stop:4189 length:3915 start_codon:yes stop_codon:yes gene_type:complete
MLNRLLFISSLLCLLIAQGVNAQQLKVVAETSSFTDYEFVNDDLKIMSSYGLTVPVSGNSPRYQILEQAVSTLNSTVSQEKAAVLALSSTNQPLIETSEPGVYRGNKVSSLSINIARHGERETLVLRKLRLRVYKEGDQVLPKQNRSKALSTSLFETGTWYKIPVTQSAIYQLDADYMESLGIDISSIDPRNIQLWGTNGYQLPELNSASRPELSQLPIIVEGQNDGVFNTNDRVLFYGNSPHQILRDSLDFSHQIHPYSNQNFVFLTIGDEAGSRLSVSNNNISPSRTITTFSDFIWKDEELYKSEDRIKSGRYWFGRRFEATSNGTPITVFSDTLPGILEDEPLTVEGQFVSRSTRSSSFDISLNEVEIADINIRSLRCNNCSSCYNCSEGESGVANSFSTSITPSIQNGVIEASATYNHTESNSTGFLDWFRIVVQRELQAKNNRLFFYSPADGSSSELGQYRLTGFDSQPTVLDVTDPTSPKLLGSTGSNGTFSVNYRTGNDLRFIAQSTFNQPAAGQPVEAQNLRGITEYPDYIIVVAEEFLEYAEELAAYRADKDGLTPVVVTQEQILNEFSSGVLDPSAIRDYTKFLYDRALNDGQIPPKYLLLFGDATYDYKDIINNSFTNYIVTYQSSESLERTRSYATDDFFGFLDDDEGALGAGNTNNSHLLDIGLGRIPAQNRSEAATAIQKIKIYEDPSNTGSWQNLISFAADDDFPDVDRNRDLHVLNADESAERMNIIEPGLRIKKIYEFAYPEEITGSGRQIPGATEEFISTLNNGTLVMNYSGHGNEQTLSDEELFLTDYIPNLTNKNYLAVLVTATCQFGRYDDIDAQSGAEQLFFAENGGVIGAFTTTRVVYTGSGIQSNNNFGLNVALSQRMVERNSDGTPLRLGDIYTRTKNSLINGIPVVSSRNSKKFILVGDPATRFRLPEQQAELTSINGFSDTDQDTTLTIRALDQVSLTGQIRDLAGNALPNYSGEATVTVMDARRNVPLPSDREWVAEERCNLTDCSYDVENDVLFRGKAAVSNGQFTSSFIVPKDISFSDDNGRIIFFANNNGTTAGGSFTKVNFNGVNENAVDDGNGPKLDIFLNDQRFVNGNLVNGSPNLIIELEDQSGINTTGTGVGHEIIATIDTKPQQSFVLNDFYEGSLNDFTRGRIEYPLDQLPEGSYTLKVRAWDVHNNPTEEEIFFEVASSEELSVRNVFNFPNPMNNATRFSFEHNQPGNPLDVSVRIYTLSGKPVQQIEQSLITTSSYASISWDGRDRDYDRLGNGTYIYVLRVTTDTPKGRQTAEQIEKLVIIR